jgi:hypothetical protein
MFGKILGRKKGEISQEDQGHKELEEKIAKMNLSDMRAYIKNRIKDFEVCEDGLNEVLHRLIKEDSKTKERYIKADDMDSKKKKAFDLVLEIVKNSKINVVTVELVQEFIDTYKDIIATYDKAHKEIYASRFEEALKTGVINIEKRAEVKNKMRLLGEDGES